MATTAEATTAEPPGVEDDGANPDNPKDGLFDAARYDGPLALPKIDGKATDRIAVKFSGTVFLDRSDEADVQLFKSLLLGHDATLMVEAKVTKSVGGFTTDKEGDLDVIVATRALTVHTLYRPAGD